MVNRRSNIYGEQSLEISSDWNILSFCDRLLSMHKQKIKIEELGYDEYFEAGRVELGLEAFAVARVIAEHKGVYRVKNAKGDYLAKITGKKIFEALSREDYPAVGDWVAISVLDEEKAVIQEILPRKTVVKRKHSGKDETQIIATNIDVALVIESVDRDFSLNRLERYLAIANDGNIKPIIILNKADLISEEKLRSQIDQIKERFENVDVISTSAMGDEGLNELKLHIVKNKTYCVLGSSGVGKSSLINGLLGENRIKVDEIGLQTKRGKHTTTVREMYFLKNGAIIIDNPGIREVGVTDIAQEIDSAFEEITALAKNCKFIDCTHIHEPGCAILSALETGKLDKEKYANYISLKKEAQCFEMTKKEKKDKSRQFGKFIKKTKNDLKKYKHKGFGD